MLVNVDRDLPDYSGKRSWVDSFDHWSPYSVSTLNFFPPI